MSASVGLRETRAVWKPSTAKPLDEALWQAWLLKGRAQDKCNSMARMKNVRWLSLAGLFVGAALWSDLTHYEVVGRFLVAAGAIVVMFRAFHAQRYAFAAVFGALALLYNPVAFVFSLSDDWHRALAVLSAVPFVASLAWRNVWLARHD
jgi:apolipoprotein N-acyltransferase